MNENQQDVKESVFVEVARSMGRSRKWRFFISIAVAIFFFWFAYIAWRSPQFAADILSATVLALGLYWAWQIFPFPAAARVKWAEDWEVAKGCRAFHYLPLFPLGIVLAVQQSMKGLTSKHFNFSDLGTAAIFIFAGAISYLICRRFVHKARSV